MDVTPLVKEGSQIIQSYANGVFRVSHVKYDGPIIVTPSTTIPWCSSAKSRRITDLQSLDEQDFAPLLAYDHDVVLLGCGEDLKFLNATLRNNLKSQGLTIEVMDTGAACRTYNVLMAEGRRVITALLPVSSQ